MKRRIYLTGFFYFIILLIAGEAFADNSSAGINGSVPEIKALKIGSQSPRIDGFLDDPIWQNKNLQFARNFMQTDPDEGEAASESTLVAVVYDDEAIYFAFWCYDDEPDKIAKQLVRRDRNSESDKISVRLDPFHDHQTGYMFTINASGVHRDARIFNDDNTDISWDGIWSSGIKMQPWGYSAEMKIPFHCIRFPEKEEHVWGVNFVRGINRRTEFAMWHQTPSSISGYISKLGHLTGLTGIKSTRHMELLPYAVSNYQTEPASAGNPDGKDFIGNAGFDFKYGLSSNLTLNATINPDFGQVELDRPVLNLSTFETFYPERRPFFLEGAEMFNTEYNMFYSRRIGRSPYRDVDDANLAYYTDYPKAATILGAAKITGKLSSGTSIAFLNAITEQENAKYVAEIISEVDTTLVNNEYQYDTSLAYPSREGVVEPKAFYSVLRIKQDLLSNSYVGGIMTLTSQETMYPALTGAIDWRLLTKNGMWVFRGQSVFSRVNNQNMGTALDLTFEKYSGKHFHAAVGGEFKDKQLQINHLGYTNRNDYREAWLWVQYRSSDDWWIVRNSWNNINMSSSWNYDGTNIGRNFNFNNNIEFINNWMGGLWANLNPSTKDDRETRDNGFWEEPVNWSFGVWLDTDERKKLSFEFDYYFGHSRSSPWWGAEFLIRYKPVSNMEFTVQTEYTHDFDQLYWVTNDSFGQSIFAEKDQNIFNLNVSASLVLNRNLSCQLSAQGLLTGLDYYDYRPYLGQNNYGALQSGYDVDYNYSALNSTLLVRWEYLPGSTLYLVWTRALEEVDRSANNLDMSRDFNRLFSGGADNVFVIKASHWLNI